ncbi:MAG: PP2C family protein-serine/threonine phosphatase [Phycisphaerales bacterium]
MRILVAEDERITRATLVRQLQGWGHTVTSAEDGQTAWAHFSAGEFDIVLTDWEMPGLSGVELIERIRAAARANYLYIILLTGRSDKSDIVRGIEAGADDFVSKPFDREELRVRLLAGERVVRLERTLNDQNTALRAADTRMRHDLRAAARVQRAMLPRGVVETPRVKTAWTYVPTDELAGDAVGIDLVDDRYLVTYVVDVSGHGVPAALLSVTAMHAMAPTTDGASLLRTQAADGHGHGARTPSYVVTELNRRFASTDNDGRFLTMVLCVLDTHTGELAFSRAGHPLPILLRDGISVPLDDAGGMPVGLADGVEYTDVRIQLRPADRLVLYSDGIIEQSDPTGRTLYNTDRLEALMVKHAATPGDKLMSHTVDALAQWAGSRTFLDDVSLVCVDWVG